MILIIASLLCLINIILWMLFFAAYKKTFSPEKLLADIRTEVNKLLIEISREADADITLIEERRRGLKTLLEEADKRILLAENQFEKRTVEKKVFTELHKTQDIPAQAQADLFDVQIRISDEARQLSQAVLESRSGYAAPQPIVLSQNRQKQPLKEQINELHQSGVGSSQIAERLKISLTEVQLAIALGSGS